MKSSNNHSRNVIRTSYCRCITLGAITLALTVCTTFGDQLCGHTGADAVTDDTTGSVLMAGPLVVGVSSSRHYMLTTTADACADGADSKEPLLDCDADGIVTLDDLSCFYHCLEGPDVAAARECQPFDLDHSGTVDLLEVQRLQQQFAGK